jgi:hypothetical protein
MQWMQMRRSLLTLASASAAVLLGLTTLDSQATPKPANTAAAAVAYQTELRIQRLTDPTPGAPQPGVRAIAPPQPLVRLPNSKVLTRQELAPAYKIARVYQLPRFTGIVANSDINITLRNAAIPRIAILHQDPAGRELVTATVKDGILTLQDADRSCITKRRDKPLQVLVDANGIGLVSLQDRSSLYAQHYRTEGFRVIANTMGNIVLHGNFATQQIEQHSGGMISLDTVKSHNLSLFSNGPGLIRLSGVVDNFSIRAVANAKIDTKYLHAKNVSVQASGIAEVAVTPESSLNGFASGHSTIYYYKTPEFIMPHTYGSGTILQMQYWD